MIISKYVNMWQTKIKTFNFWKVLFWMKIQNAAWFHHRTFPCCNFSYLEIFYIRARRTYFFILREELFLLITRAYIYVLMKSNEWKIHIILIVHLCIRNKNPGHSLQQFNTHGHFGKFDIYFQKSHTYCKMQHLWHMDKLILCQLIQHHYLWTKCFLH